MGYLRRPSGEVALDPDEQAQSLIRLTAHHHDDTSNALGLLWAADALSSPLDGRSRAIYHVVMTA